MGCQIYTWPRSWQKRPCTVQEPTCLGPDQTNKNCKVTHCAAPVPLQCAQSGVAKAPESPPSPPASPDSVGLLCSLRPPWGLLAHDSSVEGKSMVGPGAKYAGWHSSAIETAQHVDLPMVVTFPAARVVFKALPP